MVRKAVKRPGKVTKIEVENIETNPTEESTHLTAVAANSSRSTKRNKQVVLSDEGEPQKQQPPWEQHLRNLELMRCSNDAPVDRVGCQMLGDVLASPETYRFQILVSLMLSSQTKDEVTGAAMERLKNRGCTVENIMAMGETELRDLLIPVGFYKRKAMYLKKVATILHEKYNNDIPQTIDELCSLPGVGLKMANLAMQHAWDKIEGIGVDTHVHRIANRLGWVKTSTPNKTCTDLEELIPRERWATINKLLVGFGQQICLPVLPKCSECLNKDICPAIGVTKKR